jgi:ATPase family associated with various cellular activities (AAA)
MLGNQNSKSQSERQAFGLEGLPGAPPDAVAGVNVAEFGQLFELFLGRVVHGRDRPAPWNVILGTHFAEDPGAFPVLIELMTNAQRVNLQVALDVFLADPKRVSKLHGVQSGSRMWEGVTLSQVLPRDSFHTTPGAPEYSEISIGNNEKIVCIDYGLILVADGDLRYGILVSKGAPQNGAANQLRLEVVAQDRTFASSVIAEIRDNMRTYNVFRGKVVKFAANPQLGVVTAEVQSLPKVTRDDLVLAAETLERIEQHTIVFSQHREALLASGRHLRRGLLLYGPPGTGKTHTLSYLINAAPDWTAVIVSGTGFGMLSQAVSLARELQPAIVILEDVDLVAEDRSLNQGGEQGPLLFELLNEMDGLAADVDVVFALTTNRVEALERALVSRPGRIDLALEIPLPDAAGRRRLIELYARGLDIDGVDIEPIVVASEGVTASFIKELLRKAALLAAVNGTAPVVSSENLHLAVIELQASLRSVGPVTLPSGN